MNDIVIDTIEIIWDLHVILLCVQILSGKLMISLDWNMDDNETDVLEKKI